MGAVSPFAKRVMLQEVQHYQHFTLRELLLSGAVCFQLEKTPHIFLLHIKYNIGILLGVVGLKELRQSVKIKSWKKN